MKTFLLSLFLLLTSFSFSQTIIFKLYTINLLLKNSQCELGESMNDYEDSKNDIYVDELFVFNIDSSFMTHSSFPDYDVITSGFSSIKQNGDTIGVITNNILFDKNKFSEITFILNKNVDENNNILIMCYDKINDITMVVVPTYYTIDVEESVLKN